MRSVPLALALAALALLPAAAHAKPVIGIADQKSDMFTDARFQQLGVRTVRVAIAWDAMKTKWQVDEADRYLALARAAGVNPLVTWAPSRLAGKRTKWPTAAQFVTQFKKFRVRYPWIKTFSTWNEANYNGFGPWDKPELAAKWWLALRKACTTCTILGADVLDYPNMVSWVRRFLKQTKGLQPKYWGLHNYVSINRAQTYPITDLLRTVKGKVWITETGGLVAKRNNSKTKLPQGKAHAANVVKMLLTKVAKMARIQRIYLYQWNSSSNVDSWDSALVGSDGKVRPAYAQLLVRLPVPRTPLPALSEVQVAGIIAHEVPASVPPGTAPAPLLPALAPPPLPTR